MYRLGNWVHCLVTACALLLVGCGETTDEPAESSHKSQTGKPDNRCPDVCTALCNGDPEPPVPAGCPVPMCDCGAGDEGTDNNSGDPNNSGEDNGPAICPDICGAICSGLPEPAVPAGCPVPMCDCGKDPSPPACTWVRSECAAPCAPGCCPMICLPACEQLNDTVDNGSASDDARLQCRRRPDCEWVKLGCAAPCAPDCCPGSCRTIPRWAMAE